MNSIQGGAILLFFLALLLTLALRLSGEQLLKAVSAQAVVGCVGLLFITAVALHLFRPEAWTADLLKVVAGLLAGVGAGAGAAGIQQSIVGNQNVQAVNSRIEKIEGDIHRLHDSVIENINEVTKLATPEPEAIVLKQETAYLQILVPDDRFHTASEDMKDHKPPISDDAGKRAWLNRHSCYPFPARANTFARRSAPFARRDGMLMKFALK